MSDGLLKIHLFSASDIIPADADGFSDPYVVFKVGERKIVSSVINKNLNPVWNETFTMKLKNPQDRLSIEVWSPLPRAKPLGLGQGLAH